MQVNRRRYFGLARIIVTLAIGLFCVSISDAAEEANVAGGAWPAGVAPELQRIQRELGGSAVDRFEALKESSTPAWATDRQRSAERRAPDRLPEGGLPNRAGTASWAGRSQIETLRDAAGQIDVLANRLEQLELYSQADALRKQAQHLRLDARNMSGSPRATSRASALPSPSYHQEPRLAPTPMPTPAVAPDPRSAPPTSTYELAPSPGPSPTAPSNAASATAPAALTPSAPAPSATPRATPAPSSDLAPTPAPENGPLPQAVEPTPLRE